MRLPELCLALLCAADTGTESLWAARERPPGPRAAAGRAAAAGRGVDPRQAWMLLAGSPGQGSGGGVGGGTGANTAPAGGRCLGKPPSTAARAGVRGAAPASPTMPEELLRELQLLFRGMAKEQTKMSRTAREGCEEEEENSKGSPQTGAQHHVEAAFHCQTHEDITVEQKMKQELQLFSI